MSKVELDKRDLERTHMLWLVVYSALTATMVSSAMWTMALYLAGKAVQCQ